MQVKKRQALDATSEWQRYAQNPGARGRGDCGRRPKRGGSSENEIVYGRSVASVRHGTYRR